MSTYFETVKKVRRFAGLACKSKRAREAGAREGGGEGAALGLVVEGERETMLTLVSFGLLPLCPVPGSVPLCSVYDHQSYADVPVTGEGVDTSGFLEATEGLIKLFDLLGNSAFIIVQNDMKGNVQVGGAKTQRVQASSRSVKKKISLTKENIRPWILAFVWPTENPRSLPLQPCPKRDARVTGQGRRRPGGQEANSNRRADVAAAVRVQDGDRTCRNVL